MSNPRDTERPSRFEPAPVPEPVPQPIPRPFPEPLPRDPVWWRCWRLGAVSGRYEGEMTAPTAGRSALDLRVDIDPRGIDSPVLERVSADVYRVYTFRWFSRVFSWRVYSGSWIIDAPDVVWSRCKVEITGRVRFHRGDDPDQDARIVIGWGTFRPPGPAEVTLTDEVGTPRVYRCARTSSDFRSVVLEVDVCASVNAEPILPSYDTASHPNRPAGLNDRVLTVERAFAEAGVELSISPDRTVIDDSAADFATWSAAELHDAMESHFSQITRSWPRWDAWCLLAGTFDNPSTGGIMFDARAAYGGAGEAPERQGCAVFRNHAWFDELVPAPSTEAQAEAMRQLLYTYVHEIGHGFNFLHSWDKSRPDALSWMNYDWRFDARNGPDSFWGAFTFRFDEEELVHLRHGDRPEVIPGGDAWSTGWHLREPPALHGEVAGRMPAELLVRSKGFFEHMEPVFVELRLRNTADIPIELDLELNPELGGTVVYIRRPDGRTVAYEPLLCQLASPSIGTLLASGGVPGSDRFSQSIFLGYGGGGHYFSEPGEYAIRAFYQGPGHVLIPSATHRLRIGRPLSRDEERLAQDYYGRDAGVALYFGGSSSPYLAAGMDILRELSDRFADRALGAQLALVLAREIARPFFRVESGQVRLHRRADPASALRLSERALQCERTQPQTLTNLSLHALRRTRATILRETHDAARARTELDELVRELRDRGVNKSVLDEITAFAKTL